MLNRHRLLLNLVASPSCASSARRGGAVLASARLLGGGEVVDTAADAECGGARARSPWRRRRRQHGHAADGTECRTGAADAAAAAPAPWAVPVLLHVAWEPPAPPVPRAVIGAGGGVNDGHAAAAAAAVATVAAQAAAALPCAVPSSSTPPSPVEAVTTAPVRLSLVGRGSAEEARIGGGAVDSAVYDGGSATPPASAWGGGRPLLFTRVRDASGGVASSGPPAMPRAPLGNCELVEATFSGNSAAASAARPASMFAWRPAPSSSQQWTSTGSPRLHRMFSSSPPPPDKALAIIGLHRTKRVEVTLDSSASVAALAGAFAAKLGVPPARVAMTVDGAVLGKPMATLDTAGVMSGTTVVLRVKQIAKANEGDTLKHFPPPPPTLPLRDWLYMNGSALLVAAIGAYALYRSTRDPPAVAKQDRQQLAAVAADFDARRLKAVKQRIKDATGAAPHGAAASDAVRANAGVSTLPRPRALARLGAMGPEGGLWFLVAPKGEGKSTLMAQFAASRPHVLHASLAGGPLHDAACVVAAALGYEVAPSDAELAAKKESISLPASSDLRGEDLFRHLLRVYAQASKELVEAGELQPGHRPILIMDHCTRPLTYLGADGTERTTTLMPASVEVGHDIANAGFGALAFVASDPLKQLEDFMEMAGRDSIHYVRAAAFTDAEAGELLARRMFAALSRAAAVPADASAVASPTASQLAAIKARYSRSFAFVQAAVGTRARWLAMLTGGDAAPVLVLSDAELSDGGGVPIPEAYRPYLPDVRDSGVAAHADTGAVAVRAVRAAAVDGGGVRGAAGDAASADGVAPVAAPPVDDRAAGVRVDAGLLRSFVNLVEERKAAVRAVLDVPSRVGVREVTPADEALLERVLATDAALRALLAARAPLSYENLCVEYFAAHEADLRLLGEKHVVFYNHDGKTLELESELMRRVVSARLESDKHKKTMALARALLELPALSAKVDRWGKAGFLGLPWYWLAQAAVTRQETAIAKLRGEIAQLSSQPQSRSLQQAAPLPPAPTAAPA